MDLIVSRNRARWQAGFGDRTWRCAVGRGGVTRDKREGDGATPAGCWPLRRVLYRPDRMPRPETGLPVQELSPGDGWCDDPADPRYNLPVRLPYPARHERLWREDDIYDVIVVLGYNDDPPASGKGSAIFLHVARKDYSPTLGCIALARPHLLAVLREADSTSWVCVEREANSTQPAAQG